MFFEGDEIPVSNKVQPNVAIKDNLKSKDIPKNNKKNYKDDPKTVTTSDNNDNLNYFDEITFGDKFRDFDSGKANVGHQVIPGPVAGNIKSSMEDLNFVDEQYLGSSRELASNSEIPLEPLNEMKSIYTEPQIKDEQTTNSFDGGKTKELCYTAKLHYLNRLCIYELFLLLIVLIFYSPLPSPFGDIISMHNILLLHKKFKIGNFLKKILGYEIKR